MAEQKAKLREDDFVSRIVKDPKQPPDVLLLSGFLGASSEKDHKRLYFDPQLSDYVEIPNDAILHSQEMSKDQSPLGGSYVWIKQDAQIVHGKAGGDRLKANFFAGPIFQDYMKGDQFAGASPFAPFTVPPVACAPTSPIYCQTRVNCPTQSSWCPTGPQICATALCPRTVFCPTRVACPTQARWCPTLANCPTQVLFCPPVITQKCPHTAPLVCGRTELFPCATQQAFCPTLNAIQCSDTVLQPQCIPVPFTQQQCPQNSVVCPSLACPSLACGGGWFGGGGIAGM